MTDIWSKEKRSEVMSRIRGKGNRSTELRLASLLRRHGIKGWRRHQQLPGKPDFVFREQKVALFVDGCFWHGCPACYRAPASNRDYWSQKIGRNTRRDRSVSRKLRMLGWSVIRVKECALKKRPKQIIARVLRKLNERQAFESGE